MQQSGDSKPLYGDDYIQPSINSPFPLELNTLFQKQAKYESYQNYFLFAFGK